MASVSTILALIPDRIEQKLRTERTEHDLVELPLDELVPVHFVDLVLALANGALASETTGVQGTFANILLDYGLRLERGKSH